MRTLHLLSFASLAFSVASALDMVTTGSVSCEDLPVKMNITQFCNENSTCTFGNSDYVSVELAYDGLQDSVDANENDILLVEASLIFSLSGYETYDHLLLDEMLEVSICGDDMRRILQGEDEENDRDGDENDRDGDENDRDGDENDRDGDENNEDRQGEDGTCPQDGSYSSFDVNLNFPSPQNQFIGWAASGYKGEIVFDVYFNSASESLVGQCRFGIQTLRSGSFNQENKSAFKTVPSGRLGLMISLLILGALLFPCISYQLCCAHGKKTLPAKEPLLVNLEEQEEGHHNRMEASKVKRGRKSSRSRKTKMSTRIQL